jgi:hypothetical protein
MKIKVFEEVVKAEEKEIEEEELMTQAEAGKVLGMTGAGIRSAMNRQKLPTIILPGIKTKFTKKSSVYELAEQNNLQ